MAKHNMYSRQKWYRKVVQVCAINAMVATTPTVGHAGALNNGSTSLVSPGLTRTTFTLRIGFTTYRPSPLRDTTTAPSYVDVQLRIRDGASGANTKVTPGQCGTYNTFSRQWGTPSQVLMNTSGAVSTFRWTLPHNANVGPTDGSGQVWCQYNVTVENNPTPVVRALVSNVYASTGAVRNKVNVFWVDLTYPDLTSIGSVGGGKGYPNSSINVANTWTSQGTVTKGSTVTIREPVDAVVTYEKEVKLKMGEQKDKAFYMTGTGANRVKWTWTYTGDTRLFDLVGPNGNVLDPGTLQGYTGPVAIRARQASADWGVKTGNVNVTWTIP